MSKFCTGCGTALSDDDAFCPNCGTPSEGGTPPAPQPVLGPADPQVQMPGAQPVPAPAEQPVYQPIQQPYSYTAPMNTAPPAAAAPKSKKKLIIILSIAAALIIAGVILLIVLLPGGGDKSSSSSGSSGDNGAITSSPENAVNQMAAAINAPNAANEDVAKILFEYHYAKDDSVKQDAVSYAGIDYIRSSFGDDFKVTITITGTEMISETELESAKSYLAEYCTDTDSIEAIARVSADQTVAGSLHTSSDTRDHYCIKIGGKWYVSAAYHG